MPFSTPSPKRLKTQILRAAVQENADVIADRLPKPLRRSRRLLSVLGRRAWMLAVPLGVLMASAAVADRRGMAAPQAPSSPPADTASIETPSAGQLARPLSADVLDLGVHRVFIDAGHGGIDTGASSASGLLEKHLALDIATRVRSLLAQGGVDAMLTREADRSLSLRERAAVANAGRGDIFVSIHLNSLEPASARGVETYYLGPGDRPEHDVIAAAENQNSGYTLADMRALLDTIYADARRDESRHLAQTVQQSLMRRLQAVDPGIADRGVKTAPFIVLVATEMPAILAEVSCVSNAAEASRLDTPRYRQTIAEALASGIQAFIGQKHTFRGERQDSSES